MPQINRFGPFQVTVRRDSEGLWWVVCRSHGWLFVSFKEALRDAYEIASGFGVGVVINPDRRT